ncbi:hypothetical protein E2C01_042760 [Portunus trituberculatus]|uniref:Uncharacterized protein n=1 Tax=Portunus trituberculatus TaxID=210409 RepID=A0A5B7FVI3_PORTR|nr:hypothetical protein [Portunus trituberculatus]
MQPPRQLSFCPAHNGQTNDKERLQTLTSIDVKSTDCLEGVPSQHSTHTLCVYSERHVQDNVQSVQHNVAHIFGCLMFR